MAYIMVASCHDIVAHGIDDQAGGLYAVDGVQERSAEF